MTATDNNKSGRSQPASNFGAEVRQLRKARRMTLSDLAAESEISVSYLSAIERGAVDPSIGKVARIATALGVPEEWFFYKRTGQGPMERSYVVRERNRRQLNALYGETVQKLGHVDELLSSSIGGAFYVGQSEYAPKTERVVTPVVSRGGELHGVLITGELRLTINEEDITLRPGDSFSFPGEVPAFLCQPDG